MNETERPKRASARRDVARRLMMVVSESSNEKRQISIHEPIYLQTAGHAGSGTLVVRTAFKAEIAAFSLAPVSGELNSPLGSFAQKTNL